MTNIKLVFKILGLLIVVEAILLLVPAGIDLIYKEDSYMPFLTSSLITLVAGTVFLLFGRGAVNVMNRRDGFFIVAMTWVLFTVFGMLPFYISGYIPSITDCFFEIDDTAQTITATRYESLPTLFYYWNGSRNRKYQSLKAYGMAKDFKPRSGRITFSSIIGQGILREVECADTGCCYVPNLEPEMENAEIALYSVEISSPGPWCHKGDSRTGGAN